jgi:secreted trypsin-like serine protease
MLSKLKIFLLSLLTVICIPSISYASKFDIPNKHLVVNGIEIDPSIFPRTVGLVTPDKKFIFCTGTIISSDLVMTAAHCVAGMQGKKIHIIHNCQRLKGCSNVLAVKRFSIHYGYDKSKNNWNDIALLLLEEQIFLDTEVLILHPSKYETVFRDAETILCMGLLMFQEMINHRLVRTGLQGNARKPWFCLQGKR